MQPPENPNRQWCNRSRTTVEPTKSNKAGTVDMICGMAAALVVRSAAVRICGGDFDSVLIDMVAVNMVKMAVVQIIDMPGVVDGDMAAIAAVLVAVVGMVGKSAGGHG